VHRWHVPIARIIAQQNPKKGQILWIAAISDTTPTARAQPVNDWLWALIPQSENALAVFRMRLPDGRMARDTAF